IQNILAIIGRPRADRQFCDAYSGRACLDRDARNSALATIVVVVVAVNAARKTLVPRVEWLQRLTMQLASQVGHDLTRVVVGHLTAVSSSDTVSTIDEHERQDGQVVARLYPLTIIVT